jgi:hypothetical protein
MSSHTVIVPLFSAQIAKYHYKARYFISLRIPSLSDLSMPKFSLTKLWLQIYHIVLKRHSCCRNRHQRSSVSLSHGSTVVVHSCLEGHAVRNLRGGPNRRASFHTIMFDGLRRPTGIPGSKQNYLADVRQVSPIKPQSHKGMTGFYTLQLFSRSLSAKRYCLLISA